ncbi:MAG: VOC family protein [Miltoncostaeaceae bacterium]
MLSDSPAFAGFSVDDIDAAAHFYGDVLGLGVGREMDGTILSIALGGGGRAIAYPKDDHSPATFTVLNFLVDDIDATVDTLAAAGVAMIEYPELGDFDAKVVHRGAGGYPDIAWFADPAGNILSVLSTPGDR